jgi:hypothetical protein
MRLYLASRALEIIYGASPVEAFPNSTVVVDQTARGYIEHHVT